MDSALRSQAQELIDGLTADQWGVSGPSVYETARLVTLAPWLVAHERRIDFLLESQRPDGAWGGPGRYAIVPTLSATESLLTCATALPDSNRLEYAAARALRRLEGLLDGVTRKRMPDTPAADQLVLYLIDLVNGHQAARGDSRRLVAPQACDRTRIPTIRRLLRAGQAVPTKLLHALEIAGEAAAGSTSVAPGPVFATVGASPAATAAWLGPRPAPSSPARRYLEVVVGRYDGLAPVASPIGTFERAWVLADLLRAGLAADIPPALLDELEEEITPDGAATGEGLPPDADTTAVVLYVLARVGRGRAPDALRGFDTGTHFCTWPGEDGFSTTTNAHVLEALTASETYATDGPARRTADRIRSVLCRAQLDDGSWHDRWHASAYYATTTCALALRGHDALGTRLAVSRARDWVLATQRADGGWGRYAATAEETAYALRLLAATASAQDRSLLLQGLEHLQPPSGPDEYPALWHDKDLYAPATVIQCALLSSRHLVSTALTAADHRRGIVS